VCRGSPGVWRNPLRPIAPPCKLLRSPRLSYRGRLLRQLLKEGLLWFAGGAAAGQTRDAGGSDDRLALRVSAEDPHRFEDQRFPPLVVSKRDPVGRNENALFVLSGSSILESRAWDWEQKMRFRSSRQTTTARGVFKRPVVGQSGNLARSWSRMAARRPAQRATTPRPSIPGGLTGTALAAGRAAATRAVDMLCRCRSTRG